MIDTATDFLDNLQRFDLSLLVRHCQFSVEQIPAEFDDFGDLSQEGIVLRAPIPIAEALNSLPSQDRKRIAQAVLSGQKV